MTPNDLYKRMPEDSHYDISILVGCYYNHIPEVQCQTWNLDEDKARKDERIMFKVYKDFDFDGRRFWRLASVWVRVGLHGGTMMYKPVMIIRNAGREGDDFQDRIITNHELYQDMIKYLATLVKPNDQIKPDEKEIRDPNVDIPDLTEFYGNELDGHFERYRY